MNRVIDKVSTLEKVLHDKYHGVKIDRIMKGNPMGDSSPKNSQGLVSEITSSFQLKH